MERSKSNIPQVGYQSIERLTEIVRDGIRAMPKAEKKSACKELIIEIIKWSTYSVEESIGLLSGAQFHFLQMSEAEFEKTLAPQEKKKVQILTRK